MNAYTEMKKRHQEEINNFPMFFAFNDKQFNEGMEKLGLKPTDTDKIYKLGYTGGFYRKSDSEKLKGIFYKHGDEMDQAIASDKDGTGFIYDMFLYELANHEYCITWDLEPTLEACGLTIYDLRKNEALQKGLKKAKEEYMKNYE